MFASELIKTSKRNSTGEIIVTLFEQCNLECVFCTQDHTSIVGFDTIGSKIKQIQDSVYELLEHGKTEFSVNIMGGEVFDDRIPDAMFDEYVSLINNIYRFATTIQKPIDVTFVTNCVWTKTDRVKQFLDTTGADLATSYDPSGRFKSDNIQTFTEVVTMFKDYISTVNIIMTRPNIEKFMSDQIPFFDFIYANFDVYFDHYTPGTYYKELLPTDVLLRDFMIYMYHKYNDCYPFSTLSTKTKQAMSCMDTYTIMPDNDFGKCGILVDGIKALPITFTPRKQTMEQQWVDSYDCLQCIHFNRCTMGCFLSHHIKESRTQEECWLKQVYDYVDSTI
jgi:hypothetical protein